MSGYNNQLQGRYHADILTADEWRDFIARGRNKESRKAANNTVVRDTGLAVAIRLHDTDIVTISNLGDITLNSGGWLSLTTKERINRYTRAGIYQKNSVWYMADGSLFYDGMRIHADGTPLEPRQPQKYEDKLKRIKKDAREYARAFVEEIKAGNIGLPSGGDCWGCYFALNNSKNDPQPMGISHLRDHITDKYYVPSLLVNAAHDAGYRDEQCGLMGIGGHRLFIDPENVIYKYMVKYLRKEIA